MRFVHFDEAGLGDPELEPVVTVCGIISHADIQWVKIVEHLRGIATRFLPELNPDQVIFHATELFSGGKLFPHSRFTREQRWYILGEVLCIPQRFNLPIVYGFVSKAEIMSTHPGISRHDLNVTCHAQAFTQCLFQIERWIRESSAPNEVASIVVENNEASRKRLSEMRHLLRSKVEVDDEEAQLEIDHYSPLTRVVEELLFSAKTGSPLLQVADACAFGLKRAAMIRDDGKRWFNLMAPQFVMAPGALGSAATWNEVTRDNLDMLETIVDIR